MHRGGFVWSALLLVAGIPGGSLASEERLEEIVVTAQRREQALEDVAMAVSAIGTDALDGLEIDDLQSLAGFVPGLQSSPGLGSGNPVLTIRGIGSTIIWSNNNPSVAVHVDDVYYASPAFMSFPLFDLERVEVLKGPQGTLYGRNSTAGAINLIPTAPSADPEILTDARYGSRDLLELTQVIGGPLSEALAGRLAVYLRHGGGYQQTSGSDGTSAGFTVNPAVPAVPSSSDTDGYGDHDQLAFRASLGWTPSTRADVLLSVHGGSDESEEFVDRLRNQDARGFSPPSDDPFDVYNNRENDLEANQQGAVLKANLEAGDVLITSITGYEALDREFVQEDGSPYRITDGDFDEQITSLTQELRVQSQRSDGNLWLLGAFASRDDIDFYKDINIQDVLGTVIATDFDQEDESWAVFAHGEWQMRPAWRLTGGVRYTDERKTYQGGSTDLNSWGVSAAPAILPDLAEPILADRTYSDSQTTSRIALDHTPREGLMWYASASQGYKSGGFDGSLITSEASTTPYGAEKLWAYELGTKLSPPGSSLQLTLAGFYYDYTDKQVQATVDLGGGVTEAIIQNAAASEVYGGEIEMRWAPRRTVQVNAGASWLDSKITDWESADPAERAARIGNELPNAPEWTLYATLDVQRPIAPALELYGTVDVSYTGEAFREVSNNVELAADAVTLLGARAGIRSTTRQWELFLWGSNLLDEEYRVYSRRPLGAMITDQYGDPLAFGLGASWRYGK